MEKEKLDRIKELAHKKKETGLSDEELSEQKKLYDEYLAEIRASFGSILDNSVIKRPDGSVEKVKDRKKND